jgi:hypothetical protein
MGLISGQRHEPAGCAGADCFCREHQQLFGVAEPSTSQTPGPDVSEPWRGARRSKQWWRSHAHGASSAMASQSVQEPLAEALGKEAIQYWVPFCGSCALEGAQRGCHHEGKGRAPVMLQETQAVQVTQPKLSQLSDAPNFHDPWVMRLGCKPIRVSKLVGRGFQALGELGMLSAPCLPQPPPCGGEWVELWQNAVVHASIWSQAGGPESTPASAPGSTPSTSTGSIWVSTSGAARQSSCRRAFNCCSSRCSGGSRDSGCCWRASKRPFGGHQSAPCSPKRRGVRPASISSGWWAGRHWSAAASTGEHPQVSILIGEEFEIRPLERA